MFKKTMKFDDLDGNEVEQTFYFNYTKKEIAELIEFGHTMEFPPPAGEVRYPLEEAMEKLKTSPAESGLSEKENTLMAYKIFQDLLLDAFGTKGADNVTFSKTWELRNYWRSHLAFVELTIEMIQNPDLGGEFMEKCLPPRMVEAAKAELAKQESGKKTDAEIHDLVEEAARRQKDPATRIEPGLEAARAAGVAPPVPAAPEEKAEKPKSEWTAADIEALSDEEFDKLDVMGLPREAIQAAFVRKTR